MKILLLSLVLTFVFGAASAASARSVEQLNVAVNQQKTAARGKLKIRFLSLIEDSRCPTDTNCVWAGNARIEIKVTGRRGASKTFELNTGLEPQTINFEGYEIKLTDLNPKPATNVRINRNGYKAVLSVRKL